jgi:hypothetical protein
VRLPRKALHTRPRPRNGGELMRCVIVQRLEGSRFGVYRTTSRYSFECSIRPKSVAAGGSRELPSAMHLPKGYRFVYAPDHIAANRWGRSREPLVLARFGRTSDETKVARVAGYMPKRLPSRRWEQTGFVNVPTPSRTSTSEPAASLLLRFRFATRQLRFVLSVIGDKIFAELSKGSGF